jgi:probable HAF family extracellular repeat protein
VNEDNFIVGQTEGRAFTWELGGAVTVFGPGTGMYAVSDDRHAAGFRFVTSDITAADVWVGGTLPYYLGHLGSGASSAARDIENFPVVVGWSEYDQARRGLTHAFLWEDGTMHDLGTLGGSVSGADGVAVSKWPDKSYSTMYIVGYAETAGGDHHAFLWNDGYMIDLGTLPTHDYSRALAVNRSGVAVGLSRGGFFDQRAVMWVGGSIIDLNTLIDPKEGWVLGAALAINEAGQIVGGGTLHGVPRAFVLTP